MALLTTINKVSTLVVNVASAVCGHFSIALCISVNLFREKSVSLDVDMVSSFGSAEFLYVMCLFV